jgi:hypothetical protein
VDHRAVPTFILAWLPRRGSWQNSVHRFLFSLPVALVATERPFSQNRSPARQSAIDLAFEFQRLLDEGVVDSRTEIARRYGVSRARVTQVMNLLRLPMEVLNLLADTGDVALSERQLRNVLVLSSQEAQIAAARAMASKPVPTALWPL